MAAVLDAAAEATTSQQTARQPVATAVVGSALHQKCAAPDTAGARCFESATLPAKDIEQEAASS